MGSIKITSTITEIDYISDDVRVKVGDIILTSALIQHQLSEVFAYVVGVCPARFSYLGHDVDTRKMIVAIKRLVKSEDCPIVVDSDLVRALNKCSRALEERNIIAHSSMIFIDNMLLRHELKGGDRPHRVANSLSIQYFDKVLSDSKAALWAIRNQTITLNKRRAAASV